MSKSISLIHTADLHLGRCFTQLGGRGRELRLRIQKALERSVAAALEHRVDLFVVAGDLFDSPYPAREALACLGSALDRLARGGVRMIVLPGTHDPPRSLIFSSLVFASHPDQALVMSPDRPWARFDDLDLALAAWFPCRERSREWIGPAEGWHGGQGFRIGLAHGAVLPGLGPDRCEDLIPESVLHDPDLHYLALGHHHGLRRLADSSMAAYYPGSPEALAVDQKDAGRVLLVRLRSDGGAVEVEVEPIRVGSLRCQELKADVAEIAFGRDLDREIEALADPDLILDVVLEGLRPADARTPSLEDLEQRWGPHFFRLRVTDRSERSREAPAGWEAPELSVLAEFIRRMQERIARAPGPERSQWEEALALGVHYLTGSDHPS